MFPARLRRTPATLQTLARDNMVEWLRRFIWHDCNRFERHHREVGKWLNDSLTPETHTALLSNLMPGKSRWTHACVVAKNRVECRAHKECRLLYKK